MGPWNTMERYIDWCLKKAGCQKTKVKYVGRSPAAAPATGIAKRHAANQNLIKQICSTIIIKKCYKRNRWE